MFEIHLDLGRLERLPYTLTGIAVVNKLDQGVLKYQVLNGSPEQRACPKTEGNNRITSMNLIVQPAFFYQNNNNCVTLLLYIKPTGEIPQKWSLRLHFWIDRYPWRTSFSFKIKDVTQSTYA